MAVIEERKSKDGISYRVKIRLKGYKPQEATFKRKTDAKNWASSTEAAMREGRYFKCAESKKRTLAELIDKYIETVLSHKSESMKASQATQLAWWKDKAGYYLLADFTPQIIASLREELANSPTPRGEKRSNATINRYLAALSHVLTIAANEWEWLEANPVLKIKRHNEGQGRVRYLDDNERTKLLEACKDSTNKQLHTIVGATVKSCVWSKKIRQLSPHPLNHFV